MQVSLWHKNLSAILCLLMLSCVVHAEYNVENLKKLFTDKSQRVRIDAMRSGEDLDSEKPQARKIKVSGYVTRSDGKSVVWINNKNTLNSSSIDDVKIHSRNIGKNKKVTISIDGKTTSLKPGQTWNKETGVIVDEQ